MRKPRVYQNIIRCKICMNRFKNHITNNNDDVYTEYSAMLYCFFLLTLAMNYLSLVVYTAVETRFSFAFFFVEFLFRLP